MIDEEHVTVDLKSIPMSILDSDLALIQMVSKRISWFIISQIMIFVKFVAKFVLISQLHAANYYKGQNFCIKVLLVLNFSQLILLGVVYLYSLILRTKVQQGSRMQESMRTLKLIRMIVEISSYSLTKIALNLYLDHSLYFK
ncbi:hypothetical protein BpHYR1_006555 [Brachionus plicatilis]|uniref:Uncharacterized protein n=1 Tax=Brachionus plicatilis TaxID=10195 RepID=A0A3M7SZU2_BRAPC|nr:hypothetical protein BpHYR1_006555 [Brachionus plicatilis]